MGCSDAYSVGVGGGGATLSMMVIEYRRYGDSLLHVMMWGEDCGE